MSKHALAQMKSAGDRFLTDRQITDEKEAPFCREHRWRLARVGKFPSPIKFGDNTNRYRESEIDAWMASRPRAITVRADVEEKGADVDGTPAVRPRRPSRNPRGRRSRRG